MDQKASWMVFGVWAAVIVIAANAWISYQVLLQLRAGEDPTTPPIRVAVDWENASAVPVDIAAVSANQTAANQGYLPVFTTTFTGEDGEVQAVELPVRVQNTVDVKGNVGISNQGSFDAVPVEVRNWP